MKKCITIRALLAISMISLLAMGCKKEEPSDPHVEITLSTNSLTFQPNGAPVEVQVYADGPWVASTPASTYGASKNYTVTPTSGSGDGIITVSLNNVAVNMNGNYEYITLSARSNGKGDGADEGEILYLRQGDENTIKLTSPLSTQNESLVPTFTWEEIELEPANANHRFLYSIELSMDGENWDSLGATSDTKFDCHTTLFPDKLIYWRVSAEERGANFEQIPDKRVFTSWASSFHTLSASKRWEDGEMRVYQESSMGDGAFTLVVTGDGFTAMDLIGGGTWDKVSSEAIEALFSVEPYKSYRDYIRVLRIGAESVQSGTSIKPNGTTTACSSMKNTRFGTIVDNQRSSWCGLYDQSYAGQPGKTLGDAHDLIRSWVPEFTADESRMNNVAILIIINHRSYNGTVNYYDNANTTIGFVTRAPGYSTQTQFSSVVIHEIGGHGIGHLADEYRTGATSTISAAKRAQTLDFQARGFYQNVDVSGAVETSLWKHFKSGEQSQHYSEVGYFEGARSVGFGIWRPEVISCMEDNRHYFNAPSRESIVRRLMECVNEAYTFDKFVETDLKTAKAAKIAAQRSVSLEADPDFIPLHEPQLWRR